MDQMSSSRGVRDFTRSHGPYLGQWTSGREIRVGGLDGGYLIPTGDLSKIRLAFS